MFDRDKWLEIFEALTANTFRTALTAFGVLWGIFILVILLAASSGLENGVKRGFSGMATNSMFMWTNATSKPYKGLPQGRRFNFKNVDVEAIKREVPNLKYVSPRNELEGGYQGANNVVRGIKTGAYTILGDYPEFILQSPMLILQGRFINYADIQQKRKVIVIGEGIIQGLYDKNEEVLGSYIKVSGVNFKVIGVFRNNSKMGGNPEENSKQAYIPFTTFQQAFNYGETVGWMVITAKDGTSISDIKKDIFALMKLRNNVHPDDERAIGNFDLYEEFNKVNGLFAILKAIAYFVGVLVLLSGIIGITNIMLIVVKERTKEIGIRRALGASPWAIRSQILMESIVLTIVAGMTGIVLATGVLWLVNYKLKTMDTTGDMMFVNPSVDLGVVFAALMILIFSGLLAGFIPAQTAIKVKPIDALRTE
ncbi:ABC transporter permease [Flavobacterium sp. '19STA2R22 D10 B1']|uniref:ABC transporter permease n=1 Tax=Flavobacterium aerium TaxID=3037261 RepID=UPI00278C62E7|nr:ABC transporter permease [Flavobacterium sp. '19STA2R22 D10 B1']